MHYVVKDFTFLYNLENVTITTRKSGLRLGKFSVENASDFDSHLLRDCCNTQTFSESWLYTLAWVVLICL